MTRILVFTLAILCLCAECVNSQGSSQKDDVLSARRSVLESKKNREHCDKLGFPSSLSDNRCYSLCPNEVTTWGKGFSDGLAKVTVKGKVGFIDTGGRLVIPAKYRDAGRFSEGLAPFEAENGKWGFIDRRGVVTIPARFDWALRFREGLALVQAGGLWGFTDRKGTLVIQPRFAEAESFTEGVAVVGWYDPNIEWMAASPRKGRWVRRFIDKTGGWAIDSPYDGIERGFDGGMAIVSRSLGYSQSYQGMISESVVIDRSGNELWKLDSASIYSFSDDAIIVETERPSKGWSKYNFKDRTGKLLCRTAFENPSDFSEGLSAVRVKDKYGFINKKCEFVIEPRFSHAIGFSEGLAWVNDSDGRSGFIDRSGSFVIETPFQSVGSFSNGFALVLDGAKAGYIDKTGKVIWKPTK